VSGVRVDLDRLADYAAGLLEPPDASEVEALVEREPEWAAALTALTGAETAVRSALAGLGSPAVPPDVLARLDAALAAERSRGAAPVVDLAARRAGRDARPRRWRPSILAAGLTAAAAVVAVAIGGVALFSHTEKSSSMSAGEGAAKAPNAAPFAVATSDSGIDYSAATVAGAAGAAMDAGGNAPRVEPAAPDTTGDALARLRDPVARQTCLGLITAAFPPGAPSLVDFARYEGQPALIVVLSAASGPVEVVVVGAGCGSGGIDEVYATPAR
jgi:anti-sigma-K factor RskA